MASLVWNLRVDHDPCPCMFIRLSSVSWGTGVCLLIVLAADLFAYATHVGIIHLGVGWIAWGRSVSHIGRLRIAIRGVVCKKGLHPSYKKPGVLIEVNTFCQLLIMFRLPLTVTGRVLWLTLFCRCCCTSCFLLLHGHGVKAPRGVSCTVGVSEACFYARRRPRHVSLGFLLPTWRRTLVV